MEKTLDICNSCIQKTYTLSCFNCDIYKLKIAIKKLQKNIEQLKIDNTDLSNYCVFIEKEYYDLVINIIDFDHIKTYKQDLYCLLPQEKNISYYI